MINSKWWQCFESTLQINDIKISLTLNFTRGGVKLFSFFEANTPK